jgi:hypothetical protein
MHCNARTLCGETFCHGSPDAGGRTGDENRLAGKVGDTHGQNP